MAGGFGRWAGGSALLRADPHSLIPQCRIYVKSLAKRGGFFFSPSFSDVFSSLDVIALHKYTLRFWFFSFHANRRHFIMQHS